MGNDKDDASDKRLKRAEKAIMVFSNNAKKSPARLQTATAIRTRLEGLVADWKEFHDAFAEFDDADGQYDDADFAAVEEAYAVARNELLEMLSGIETVQPPIIMPGQQQQQQGIRMKATPCVFR